MASKSDMPAGHGRLLEAWEPTPDAGEPVGCVATTFTFSPSFFEEECLARFLKLETDPIEDGAAYLIEREEKLAQVVCAAVLVDQHHCKGARSLRWDLYAARPARGFLHAKISLLCWSSRVRLIIGSANLTEDGYRRNREVFGVLDFHEGSPAPRKVLLEALELLRELSARPEMDATSGPVQRLGSFLDRVRRVSAEWGLSDEGQTRDPMHIASILTGPGRADLFNQAAVSWPGGSLPDKAWVLSPFFDPPEARTNAPAEALWDLMRERGESVVEYCVEAEDSSDRGKLFVRVPRSLLQSRPAREACTVQFGRLTTDAERPLHAKGIWLESDRWVFYVVGSSNFTSPGTGVGNFPNYEANIAYVLDKHRATPLQIRELVRRFPETALIKNPDESLQFLTASEPGADDQLDTVLLPMGFKSAVYQIWESKTPELVLAFGDGLPGGWALILESEDRLLDEAAWSAGGSPDTWTIEWDVDHGTRPPSGLWVSWKDAGGKAWWPVNVANAGTLPPPDELRDLPLELLIEILTSARPLHEVMRGRRRGKHNGGGGSGDGWTEADPHKRVDTSGFLLQRTRRFSWALSGLRTRLERAVPTEECLDWRIRGPVGVMALASALRKQAKSNEERAFLLAELALELTRVKPATAPGSLPSNRVRKALKDAASELASGLSESPVGSDTHLDDYLASVREKIGSI